MCTYKCGSPSVLFDCYSLTWVHGKPAVYFLTLIGYLCRYPTLVQLPPGFVCRCNNNTPYDTPRKDNSHCATTVARMTHSVQRLMAQLRCENNSWYTTTWHISKASFLLKSLKVLFLKKDGF